MSEIVIGNISEAIGSIDLLSEILCVYDCEVEILMCLFFFLWTGLDWKWRVKKVPALEVLKESNLRKRETGREKRKPALAVGGVVVVVVARVMFDANSRLDYRLKRKCVHSRLNITRDGR
ncbi:hypothetical protein AAC387_Pa01g1046 [Persea americana]